MSLSTKQVTVLSEEVDNSEDSRPASGQLTERNCFSIIIIWERLDFHKRLGGKRVDGGAGLKQILEESNFIRSNPITSESELKFVSQSTLDGNQVRKDFVFKTGCEAKYFNLKVMVCETSCQSFHQIFSAELGFQQEPFLTELDVLHLVKHARLKHLLRHFLTCNVVTEDHKIMFRFSSISDVNLFLFNKCSNPRKRTLGIFRKSQEQLRL